MYLHGTQKYCAQQMSLDEAGKESKCCHYGPAASALVCHAPVRNSLRALPTLGRKVTFLRVGKNETGLSERAQGTLVLRGKQPGAQMTVALESGVLGLNDVAATRGAGHWSSRDDLVPQTWGLAGMSAGRVCTEALRGRAPARGNTSIPKGRHRQSPLPISVSSRVGNVQGHPLRRLC